MKAWNNKGRRIHKGSKACGFTKDGIPLFSKDQTYTRTVKQNSWISKSDYIHTEKEEEPKVRYYSDGSCEVMFGGPCGSLYLDYNGES